MTANETPAETLRRAAKLMRQRAEKATPGPWERPLDVSRRTFVGAALPDDEYPTGHLSGLVQDYGQKGYTGRYIGQRERCVVVSAPAWNDGTFDRGSFRPPDADHKPPSRSGRDLDYIASMHPGVALALADLLEYEAALIDAQVFPQSDPAMDRYPLAVARAYLGESA